MTAGRCLTHPAVPALTRPPNSPGPTPTRQRGGVKANSTLRGGTRAPRGAGGSGDAASALPPASGANARDPPRPPPGDRGRGGAQTRGLGAPRDPSPLPRPPPSRPRSPYNLCSKNTCRHGCASRVENVGLEMVRFLRRRPGTRLEKGGVGG